jgi:hypothetical protein
MVQEDICGRFVECCMDMCGSSTRCYYREIMLSQFRKLPPGEGKSGRDERDTQYRYSVRFLKGFSGLITAPRKC